MNITCQSYNVEYSTKSKARRISFTIHVDVSGLGQSFQFLIPFPPEMPHEDRESVYRAAIHQATQILEATAHDLKSKTAE